MQFACRIIKTKLETIIILNSFHSKNGYANALECYVVRTFPLLLSSENTCDTEEWICTKLYCIVCVCVCVYLLNGSAA